MIKEAIERLRIIAESLPDDDPDKAEILNTEGDFQDLMEWALRKRNDYNATAESCKELAETYTVRRKSFENKSEHMKDLISVLMSAAGEKKFQGVGGTVSVKAVPPKPIVIDESLIPEDYFEITKKLQKSLVNQAVKDGYEVPGVCMDNGSETISIRTR